MVVGDAHIGDCCWGRGLVFFLFGYMGHGVTFFCMGAGWVLLMVGCFLFFALIFGVLVICVCLGSVGCIFF